MVCLSKSGRNSSLNFKDQSRFYTISSSNFTRIIPKSTNQFLQLMETYSLSHKLSIPDALIAATALVHNLELFTLNIKDFRFIPGLTLFNPEK
ncbi:MAG: PIN domain-containing protein [Candidatus Promineifilaceae bacterium]